LLSENLHSTGCILGIILYLALVIPVSSSNSLIAQFKLDSLTSFLPLGNSHNNSIEIVLAIKSNNNSLVKLIKNIFLFFIKKFLSYLSKSDSRRKNAW